MPQSPSITMPMSCYAFPSSLHTLFALSEHHSFPTRRSSDLGARWSMPCSPTSLMTCSGKQLDSNTRIRSEEHTSELQSRFELVCRLLLEKKKPDTLLQPFPPNPLRLAKINPRARGRVLRCRS